MIAFRADASVEMGSGHIMRCLSLADKLAQQGMCCHFLSRPLKGFQKDLIPARGHMLTVLDPPSDDITSLTNPDLYERWLGVSKDADANECASHLAEISPDLIVVDSYALDARWHQCAVSAATPIMVIDDLANRPHSCDILLDQNLGRQESDYHGLLPDHTKCLIGPDWAMLRPEFAEARGRALERRLTARLSHILIAMGGMDKDNATGQILSNLVKFDLHHNRQFTVVLGSSAPHLPAIREFAQSMSAQVEILCDVRDMGALMASADLSIGGSGSTAWERCCLGLPTITLTIAENQIPIAMALDKAGAAPYLGDIRSEDWKGALPVAMKRMDNKEWRMKIGAAAADICDGLGTARVLQAINTCLNKH